MDKSELILSSNIVAGLKILDTKLNIELSKKLLSNVVKLAFFSDHSIPSNPEVSASNPDYVKQCEYAVTMLLVLAGRHDYDNQMLKNLLNMHEISSPIIDEILKIYDISKQNFLSRNLRSGYPLPHLLDIEWTSTCDIPSQENNINTTFHINLLQLNETSDKKESIVKFDCNTEELHSIIIKLKEIEQHCKQVCT